MKTQKRVTVPICLLTILVLGAVCPVRSAGLSNRTVRPDLPLPQLLTAASTDINKFWLTNFVTTGRRYTVPTLVPYTQPFKTPCGTAVMNNAFYCPASNTIYFDNNFIAKFYRDVGDYAAVSIIAHEWGHLVQTQLGYVQGQYFSIQMELQADCFAGSYTRYAEAAGELDPGDLEEAGVSLFNGGDTKEMPWFAPGAHGQAMQRISFFLDGYKGRPCFSR